MAAALFFIFSFLSNRLNHSLSQYSVRKHIFFLLECMS